jgi:hypothetical protein
MPTTQTHTDTNTQTETRYQRSRRPTMRLVKTSCADIAGDVAAIASTALDVDVAWSAGL